MDCIFCKIIRKELPASIVYEDDQVVAFMDIRPINPGHVLVVPKACHASLRELPDALAQQVLQVVTKVEKSLWVTESLQCQGTNILQNNGAAAGQDVFHVHFHVVPRFEGDGFRFRYEAKRPSRLELDGLAEAIGQGM